MGKWKIKIGNWKKRVDRRAFWLLVVSVRQAADDRAQLRDLSARRFLIRRLKIRPDGPQGVAADENGRMADIVGVVRPVSDVGKEVDLQ